jgi:hypothetical protein
VVTVGKVVHGLELLVDNANASLVGAVGDLLDVRGGLSEGLELLVDDFGGLDGGLRVEFGCSIVSFIHGIVQIKLTGVGDLEENVLHDVATVRALELELVALEQDIVETPDRGRENGVDTTLALLNLQDQVDSALASVTSSPRLPGHGVGGVSVSAETLAINPRLCDGIGGLLLVEAEKLGNNSSGSDLDQNNVVQTDLVVGVLQSQNTLDFVSLDHGLQNILNCQNLATSNVSTSAVGARDPVGNSKNTTQVVRGVTPLGGKPAVVVIEPTDHGTNVKGTVHGVKLVRCTGHASTVGDNGALDNRAEELGALFELQSFQTTAEGIEENQSSSVELQLDLV